MSTAKASHHVQDPAAVVALKNLKDKVQSEIQKYRGGRDAPRAERPPHMNDFSRLARRICSKSIGVVLGGGGARGIGHLVSSLTVQLTQSNSSSTGRLKSTRRIRDSSGPHRRSVEC